MDLIELLKQFKNIEPDQDYTRKSRSLILHPADEKKFGFLWKLFFKNIELGAALALTGLLIFMILGGFSAWRVASPLQVSNLDPVGLKAEAQAIDIQIELANLNYTGGTSATAIKSAESTPAVSQPAISQENLSPTQPPADQKPEVIDTPTAPDNTSTSSVISIDEALQKLSE